MSEKLDGREMNLGFGADRETNTSKKPLTLLFKSKNYIFLKIY